MRRHPAFQRRMAQFALLAMLLLALMPTVHRLLAERAAPAGAGAGWVELCTGTGLKLVKLGAGFSAAAGTDLAAGETDLAAAAKDFSSAGSHAGDASLGDCAYCPLLQATLAVALALLLVARLRHRDAAVPWRSARHADAPYPCGLGSRGPPLFA
jgi:hypothetical protein